MSREYVLHPFRAPPQLQIEYARELNEQQLAAVSAPLRLVGLNPCGALASLRKLHTSADYFRFFSGRRRHYKERVWHNRDRGSTSVADAIQRGGAMRRLSSFAKIDIEGAEYRILPGVCDHAELFTGLVVEFHDTDICYVVKPGGVGTHDRGVATVTRPAPDRPGGAGYRTRSDGWNSLFYRERPAQCRHVSCPVG